MCFLPCLMLVNACPPPPVPYAAADTPAQRVQFLLGTEDGDEEHIPHALFTELDEICLREGEDAEWKETARYSGHMGWNWPAVTFILRHTWVFVLMSVRLRASFLLYFYFIVNYSSKITYFRQILVQQAQERWCLCVDRVILIFAGGWSLRRMLRMVANGGVNPM